MSSDRVRLEVLHGVEALHKAHNHIACLRERELLADTDTGSAIEL